jgi:RND family efflux transporter MFP subunit
MSIVVLSLAGAGVVALQGGRDAAAARTEAAVAPAALAAEGRGPQAVRAAVIRLEPLQKPESFTGTVRPRIESNIAFRVAGKIVARDVDVGDRVAAGQVVARLDDADLRLALAAADAEVAAAMRDRARMAEDAARAVTLHAQGHIARAALDDAETALAQAEARADRAVQARDQAANALDYAVLRAPAAGVVTAAAAEPGQVVGAGSVVLRLARTDRLEAEIALPEQRRALLQATDVTATLWGEQGRTYALTLREVSPDVDPGSRTYRVRFAFDAGDGAALALGRTLTLRIAPPPDGMVATVPLGAVMNDGTGASVWKVGGTGRAVRVPVTIAALTDTAARVKGQLADGDRIVALGAHKVDPARGLRVVETMTAAQD